MVAYVGLLQPNYYMSYLLLISVCWGEGLSNAPWYFGYNAIEPILSKILQNRAKIAFIFLGRVLEDAPVCTDPNLTKETVTAS